MKNKTRQEKTWSVSSRLMAVDWRKGIQSLVRSTGIGAAILIGTCAGHAGDLPRPGDSTDAGDSYLLRDGSRVVLRRLVNEAAVKHVRSKSVDQIVRQARISGDPWSRSRMENRTSSMFTIPRIPRPWLTS